MTRFSLTACLPPTPPEQVRTALDAAPAPFDVWRSGEFNSDGEWDYWRLETDPDLMFAVRPDSADDPRLLHAPGPRTPLRCAGGPRALLDLDATASPSTTALLTPTGHWTEDDHHGPSYLASLPGDRVLVRLLCHT